MRPLAEIQHPPAHTERSGRLDRIEQRCVQRIEFGRKYRLIGPNGIELRARHGGDERSAVYSSRGTVPPQGPRECERAVGTCDIDCKDATERCVNDRRRIGDRQQLAETRGETTRISGGEQAGKWNVNGGIPREKNRLGSAAIAEP
ncbi:MAG: hypothetical protein NVS3B28_14260 [Candidatus Velthaea sp.]